MNFGALPRSAPGGNEACGTIGPESATVPVGMRATLSTCTPCSAPRGAMTRPVGSAAGLPPAPRRAAIRPISPNTGMSISVALASPGARSPCSRSGARQTASTVSPSRLAPINPASARRITIGPGSTATAQCSSARWRANTAGANGWCSTSVPPVSSQGRIMLARLANEAQRERAEEHRVGLGARFEMHRKARGDQFGMAARDRHDAVRRDVEGDQRDVIGRLALALDRRRLVVALEDIVERHDAVRQVLAEAAQEADGEGLGRDVHREIAMHDVADALAADQRARRDAAERRRRIGMAPQQRQRRGDQSGAHHGEQRDHALHRVGKLDRHHGVGRQAEARAAAPRAPRWRGRPARK